MTQQGSVHLSISLCSLCSVILSLSYLFPSFPQYLKIKPIFHLLLRSTLSSFPWGKVIDPQSWARSRPGFASRSGDENKILSHSVSCGSVSQVSCWSLRPGLVCWDQEVSVAPINVYLTELRFSEKALAWVWFRPWYPQNLLLWVFFLGIFLPSTQWLDNGWGWLLQGP